VETFGVRVHHEMRMRLVQGRGAARRVLQRSARDLKGGVRTEAGLAATGEGTPHGGPGSPLRAHLLLAGLEKALARRGHRGVRYADACNLDVQSVQARQRVRANVTRCVARRLTLRGNAANSAVARPWRRTWLGCPFTGHRPNRRRVSTKALRAFKPEVCRRTARTWGVALGQVLRDRRRYLEGGYGYGGVAEVQSGCKALDSWLRRRLRG
jgi:RNA-directed DNA polymerase